MRTAWLRRLTPLLILALLAGAVALLHRELSAYRYEDVRRAIRALRGRQIEIALALTVVSYVILTAYDALALRYLGRPLAYRRTALASFLGYAFAHNIGFSVLGGAAPRYRLYASWGLPPSEISLLIGFTAATFWLGVCAVTGTAMIVDPVAFAGRIGLPSTLGRIAGGALLAIVRRRGRPAVGLAPPARDPRLDGAAAAPAHRDRAGGGRRRRLDRGRHGALRPDAVQRADHLRALRRALRGRTGGRRQQPRAGRPRRVRDRHPARPGAARAFAGAGRRAAGVSPRLLRAAARGRDAAAGRLRDPPAQRAPGGGRRGRRPLDLGDGAAGDGAGDLRQRRAAALLRRGPPPRRPPRHAARRPADSGARGVALPREPRRASGSSCSPAACSVASTPPTTWRWRCSPPAPCSRC